MSVYNKNGTIASLIYNVQGNVQHQAYDVSGNPLIPGRTLKVMQYNCGQWYIGDHDNVPANKDEEYYELQSGIIQRNDADILFIEEYTAQFSKTGRTAASFLAPDYPYYHEQTDGTTTTVVQRAIYSKYPISNYQTHIFSEYSYYYDTCNVTIDDLTILLVVAHLHWNNINYRASEAQAILSAVANAPYFIIGGDFNLEDFSSTSGQDYTRVIKPFVDAGYNIANGGRFGFIPTFTSNSTMTDTENLDEVITSSNIEIINAYTDNTKANDSIVEKIDHLPLIAELEIY